MAEIKEGGVYKVGDQLVNAEGKEVKGSVKASPYTRDGAAAAAAEEATTFASPEAEKAATDAGLTAADFAGAKPSGANGYTTADVKAVADAKSKA